MKDKDPQVWMSLSADIVIYFDKPYHERIEYFKYNKIKHSYYRFIPVRPRFSPTFMDRLLNDGYVLLGEL